MAKRIIHCYCINEVLFELGTFNLESLNPHSTPEDGAANPLPRTGVPPMPDQLPSHSFKVAALVRTLSAHEGTLARNLGLSSPGSGGRAEQAILVFVGEQEGARGFKAAGAVPREKTD